MSVRWRENRGVWEVSYSLHGKRRTRAFKKKKDADRFDTETQHEIAQGTHTPKGKTTIAEACEMWNKQAYWRDSTRTTSLVHVRRHINPFIGAVKLSNFTKMMDVERFRQTLIDEGRSLPNVKHILGSLGGVLQAAMRGGLVGKNIVHEYMIANAARDARISAEYAIDLEVGVNIATQPELGAMLAVSKTCLSLKYQALLALLAFTGMRAGEIRGVWWRDIDLDNQIVHVRRSVDIWNKLTLPKSKSGKREIPLGPPQSIVVNLLREWKLACPKSGPDDHVFPSDYCVDGKSRGKPHSGILGIDMIYKELIKVQVAAGIMSEPTNRYAKRPKYSLHKFRHGACSLFMQQGYSPKQIIKFMGWSSIRMIDRYAHLFPTPVADQDGMSQIQARVLAAAGGRAPSPKGELVLLTPRPPADPG